MPRLRRTAASLRLAIGASYTHRRWTVPFQGDATIAAGIGMPCWFTIPARDERQVSGSSKSPVSTLM